MEGIKNFLKSLNPEEKKKLTKAAALSAAGVAAAASVTAAFHEGIEKDKQEAEREFRMETMPADQANPTAGKTSDSAPDPITIPKPETGVL